MQNSFIWPFAAPGELHSVFTLALPYFGKAPAAVRDAVTFLDVDGNNRTYDDTMNLHMSVEPLTGGWAHVPFSHGTGTRHVKL